MNIQHTLPLDGDHQIENWRVHCGTRKMTIDSGSLGCKQPQWIKSPQLK